MSIFYGHIYVQKKKKVHILWTPIYVGEEQTHNEEKKYSLGEMMVLVVEMESEG